MKTNLSNPSSSFGRVDSRVANAIAHWEFETQEWQRFLEFDKQKRDRQDKREGVIILVLVVLALTIALVAGALGPVAGILILTAILGLGAAIHFIIQKQRYRQMEVGAANGRGDVYITPNGIWTNGIWFDWGDQTPWRLITVTPVLADMGVGLSPGELSYIEFKCRGRAAGRHPISLDKKWRVPVPRGKENEAREVVAFFGTPTAHRDKFGLPDD